MFIFAKKRTMKTAKELKKIADKIELENIKIKLEENKAKDIKKKEAFYLADSEFPTLIEDFEKEILKGERVYAYYFNNKIPFQKSKAERLMYLFKKNKFKVEYCNEFALYSEYNQSSRYFLKVTI